MPALSLTAILATFCLLLPPQLVLVSKAVVPLSLIATAAAYGVILLRRSAWPVLPDRTLTICLLALFAWGIVATAWSHDGAAAIYLALRTTAMTVAGLLLLAVGAGLGPEARGRIQPWIVGGFFIGLAVLALERGLGQPLYTTFADYDTKQTLLSRLNRGATALAILVWPVTGLLYRGRAGAWALLLPLALFAVLCFLESLASLFGLWLGGLFGLLALLHRRAGRILAATTVVAVALLSPLVAKGLHSTGLADSGWLDGSSQQRIEIWNFAAERIAERPVFGWGFDAADAMRRQFADTIGNVANMMPNHPHNVPLQIWLELGIVGLALFVATLLILVWRIDRLPRIERLAAQCAFASGLAISLVGYGTWQSQWIATLFGVALTVVLCREGRRAARADARGGKAEPG